MTRYLLPVLVFGAIAVLLAVGLDRNPRLVPSPLVGKQIPAFELPLVRAPERSLAASDLKGQVSLLNVWATWCTSCRQEHDMLMAMAREGAVPIYGLNYKDNRDNAIRWLAQLGDPYVASGFDADGRTGLDLGVYGAPETYVIDRLGRVAYKHIGPVTAEIWRETLAPLVRALGEGKS